MRTLPDSTLFDIARFPSTRYQGSKRRSAGWIVERLAGLPYRTVLDAFGGTGSVAHAFKRAGKTVTYNDALRFNHQIGLALIENDDERLDDGDRDRLLVRHAGVAYGDVVARNFSGIYFTDEENAWLDQTIGNIRGLLTGYRQSLAYFALFQAALAKRPYNLFHRRNLYVRQARVTRSFGNKTTWDRPFADHFRAFALEGSAAVFRGDAPCRAICCDVMQTPANVDLVYLDPPYVNDTGVGVDYRDFYHFLEGIMIYDEWPAWIDVRSPHRRLCPCTNPWTSPATNGEAFRELIRRFDRGTLVVSYRCDGTPSIEALEAMLREVRPCVTVHLREPRPYVLSTRRASREALLVGTHQAWQPVANRGHIGKPPRCPAVNARPGGPCHFSPRDR